MVAGIVEGKPGASIGGEVLPGFWHAPALRLPAAAGDPPLPLGPLVIDSFRAYGDSGNDKAGGSTVQSCIKGNAIPTTAICLL